MTQEDNARVQSHHTSRSIRAAGRKALAFALCVCLAVAYTPGLAYAAELATCADEASGSIATDDGWTLTYEATADDDGSYEATITGATDYTGTDGSLSIPASVTLDDGTAATVSAIGASAFYASVNSYATNLVTLVLPDTVTTFGERAFQECTSLVSVTLSESLEALNSRCFEGCSALESVVIPASVAYISSNAFYQCTSLESATVEGDTLEFLGYQAFAGCTSLVSFDVPPLAGGEVTYRYTKASTKSTDSYRLGYKCFYGCSSLELVRLLPGADGTYYFNDSNTDAFTGVSSDFKLLIYVSGADERSGHSSNTSGVATVSNRYYAMSFYSTQAASASDTYGTSAEYQGLYASGTLVSDVLNGKAEAYVSTGTMPELEEGYSWGTDDVDITGDTTVADCYHFYPSFYDLANAYVSVPTATSTEYSTTYGEETTTSATVFLVDGMQDLSGIAVYSSDGSLIDASNYELVYLRVETSTDSSGNSVYSYTLVDADEAWDEGTYMVYAVGVGNYEGTTTGAADETSPTGYTGVSFTVSQLTMSVSEMYTGTTRSSVLGTLGVATSSASGSKAEFVVIASADNPQHMLIASWLAGMVGGQAVFTEGDNTADRVFTTIIGASVGKVYVVGGEEAVGTSVIERMEEVMGMTSSEFAVPLEVSDADDEASLAEYVYETIAAYADEYDYTWGDTAFVASSTQSFATSSVASYVYQAVSPVFFANEDGSISTQTLADLAAGGFSDIVVAGDASHVSDAVVASIAEATGATVKRMADSQSAFAGSLDVQMACDEAFVDDDGKPLADDGTIVVASALDASYVITAAQYAIAKGYELVTVASTADIKALVEYAIESSTSSIVLVGDFTTIENALAVSCGVDIATYLADTYASPDTGVAAGDTVERCGVLYTLESSGEAEATALLEGGVTALSLEALSCDDVEYAITSIDDSTFKGATLLASIDITDVAAIGALAFYGCSSLASVSTSASSIGASAFAGCSALASATLSSTALASIEASTFQGCSKLASVSIASTALTSVGAKAFYGCSAMTSATISSTALKTIGASAFQGCSKLASVSIASTALTSVGAKAFYGCKALKSISLKSKKLTSVGASAFYGCSALASATISSTALKTIGASAFQGCSKLASVSIASTALTSVGSKAFYGCKALKSVTLKSKKLTSIGASAFAGCSALAKATISSTKLKSVAASTFSGCSKLASVSIASTALTSVGSKAFYGCKKLKSISLKSKKLKTIGASAFSGCSALAKATLSSTKLTSIGAKAFYGCKKLKTLVIKSKKLKKAGSKALKGAYKKLTVKVPSAKVKAYKKLLKKAGLPSKATVKKG